MSAARPSKRQRFTDTEHSRKAVRVFAEDSTSIIAQATEEEGELCSSLFNNLCLSSSGFSPYLKGDFQA